MEDSLNGKEMKWVTGWKSLVTGGKWRSWRVRNRKDKVYEK